MNDLTFEAELQETFLAEADEILDAIEVALIAIEVNPEPAQIDKIFRLMHTLKGSALVAGFSELGHLAHGIESLLSPLRSKDLAVTRETVDVLLEGNDALRKLVQVLRKDSAATTNYASVVEHIRSLLSGTRDAAKSKAPAAAEPMVNAETDTDTDAETEANSALASAAGKAPAEQFPSVTILVCDDEPQILELIRVILVDDGFKVVEAGSPLQALEIFRSQPIDVIFTDLMMPEMDGIAFATAIRAVNAFIPIAFISGHSSREHLKDYLALGVDSFIEKPFNSPEVLKVAHRLTREAELRKALIGLSKLSFQAYVLVDKIMTNVVLGPHLSQEKKQLDHIMEHIRIETQRLLNSERALRR